MRRCTSKIPSVKTKFQQLVESQVIKHKLRDRIDLLYEKAIQGAPFTSDDAQEYERSKERMQQAVKYGDT
jgi:hypothetical protein